MKLSYSDVDDYCNELHNVAKNMKNIFDEISSLSSTISSNDKWTGPAANYYISRLKKFSDSFDVVFQELENSILFMAKCSDGYQAIDKIVIKEICENLNITEPNLSTSNIFNGE